MLGNVWQQILLASVKRHHTLAVHTQLAQALDNSDNLQPAHTYLCAVINVTYISAFQIFMTNFKPFVINLLTPFDHSVYHVSEYSGILYYLALKEVMG
jgi:hypothetical protein